MDIFKLMRDFWDFSFENPNKVNPNHCALYFFIVEHCNRLGWKSKFGLPTEIAKEAIGIKSYNTYIKTLNELVDFGFIILIEKSKNQYSSNIVALSEFDKALDKALDKAFINHESKHLIKQDESTQQTNSSIDIQYTIEPINNIPITKYNFKQELINLGADKNLVDEWLLIRKTKKLTNTKTALESFVKEVNKKGKTINEVLTKCVTDSWGGFKATWDWKEDSNLKNISNGKENTNGFASNR